MATNIKWDPYIPIDFTLITSASSDREVSYAGDEADIVATSIKAGDWVRVLRNNLNALSPYADGTYLKPYEAIKARDLEFKMLSRKRTLAVTYASPRNIYFIPVADVEKIEDCICAGPVIESVGCRCGYTTMIKESI